MTKRVVRLFAGAADFVRDRDHALRSMDKETIKKYLRKYKITVRQDERRFWATVHKMRVELPSFTSAEKAESEKWLRENWK